MFSTDTLLYKILIIPGILVGFTFHEYAHAWMADRLGDKTPKFQDRLTLNPLAHIDPIGFLMILIIGIGWAKPVETNPNAFKNYYKDDLKVSIAGVIGNLFAALIFTVLLGVLSKLPLQNEKLFYVLYKICLGGISINCLLAVFNLLPIPGLDGFHILRDLFPKFFYEVADKLYRYQMIILLVLILPILGGNSLAGLIIYPPTNLLTRFFLLIVNLIV
ncbi:site-2 protease family protein [Clostridium brassicae]|uniref:Site-2 protease family protein n=1 Tax=Clostridium brassicae TaxID=2999072 RepID=A0ABT4D470_9CLOT|nr:site-2 protease family protein [Clostridium brassicae]MCY6957086.1 site-2 protease family protein [Clostridium brassicae]